jgi:hypothetical protein
MGEGQDPTMSTIVQPKAKGGGGEDLTQCESQIQVFVFTLLVASSLAFEAKTTGLP